MINCNKCKSNVNRNMKHSLKSNECPFCGNYLLNNEDLKACKEISYDLLNAGFKESEIYDMSIFIYNNYLKKTKLDQKIEPLEEIEDNSFFEEEIAEESFSEEIKQDDSPNFDSIDEDEDEDDKVSRLRKLAKSNPILNKKGASVRRIDPR